MGEWCPGVPGVHKRGEEGRSASSSSSSHAGREDVPGHRGLSLDKLRQAYGGGTDQRAYWRRVREQRRREQSGEPYRAAEQAGQLVLFGDDS